MEEAETGAELAKFAMMKSCFEINFWEFIHILFYSKLFNLEVAVKIRKNRALLSEVCAIYKGYGVAGSKKGERTGLQFYECFMWGRRD